ncbi:glycosyltransferase family 87 protein [Bradyrhizobium pachyrhizi]|uniref:glycosyltransferase family 87 protein n=1 Tax=Bradyrhizobium pachyrhizi TaxID=280333 RepID=UPI0024B054CA|nr:glycosyltransferase family 87 protein [Bradyrhizobium pachyrhizi]WFU55704.1 glycosyltransferase family 87 protein [Bradyrhizobium pachyrhizi]
MLATTLETIQSTDSKRANYTRGILVMLVAALLFKVVWFSQLGLGHGRELVDFAAFYITAKLVWLGDLDQAYQFAKLAIIEKQASGGHDGFMPWTYPPQFNLLLAPFALVPFGMAYLLFMASTLAVYLAVLRRLAGNRFVLVLIVFFPTIGVTLACGQNSFLTAALIGLVCLYFEERPMLAGAALGLMIIKPHFAVAFALYAILRRSWIVVMTAGAVVLISSAICTVLFGMQIWPVMLQSVHDSSVFLREAYYPLYRMVSTYAALRTTGVSASAAFIGQGIVAVLALGIVLVAVYRKMPVRESLGLTAIVSVCFSPYAYDYDFLIFSIGLALLLPALQAKAREWERAIIYAAPIPIGAFGYMHTVHNNTPRTDVHWVDVLSIGGFGIAALITLIVAILLLRESSASDPVPAQGPLARI